MSEEMTVGRKIARCFMFGFFALIFGIFALMLLASAWPIEALIHLIGGFIFFLGDNLASLTTNADIWVPGITAFLLSLLVIHYLGRGWAMQKNKHWRISNTLSLGMITPILFAVAFVIPGALLQMKMISGEKILERRGGSDRSAANLYARNYTQAVVGYTHYENLEQFPESLSPHLDEYISPRELYRNFTDTPDQGIIYLGNGFGPDSDPELPLIISAPYIQEGQKMRFVWTIGANGSVEILDTEVDEWIQRSIDARKELENAPKDTE